MSPDPSELPNKEIVNIIKTSIPGRPEVYKFKDSDVQSMWETLANRSYMTPNRKAMLETLGVSFRVFEERDDVLRVSQEESDVI